jgi:hypothetical protein
LFELIMPNNQKLRRGCYLTGVSCKLRIINLNIIKMNKVSKINVRYISEYLKLNFGKEILILLPIILVLFPQHSIIAYLVLGIFSFVILYIISVVIKFLYYEFVLRLIVVKYLSSDKYDPLYKLGFVLKDDLFFEGKYLNYHMRVVPFIKFRLLRISRVDNIITTYYQSDNLIIDKAKEEVLTGDYFNGLMAFDLQSVACVPKKSSFQSFEKCFDGIVYILNREGLQPLSLENWERDFGRFLRE